MKKEKLLSVVVTVYNTERFLKECLHSLMDCSYKNMEIIVVNDDSKGNCSQIIENFYSARKPIKYVENTKNMGLFRARIIGVEHSSGDYITFLDSDDHVSVDLYRRLIAKAECSNADLVMGEMIMEHGDNEYSVRNISHTQMCDIDVSGDGTQKLLFGQYGLDFILHSVWGKIYSRLLWNKCYPYLTRQDKHLIMCEDVLFSSIFYYFSEHVVNIHDDFIYYRQWKGSSTAGASFEKLNKNIKDIKLVFDFLQNFFTKQFKEPWIVEKLSKWFNLYQNIYKHHIEHSGLSNDDKDVLSKLLGTPSYFEEISSPFSSTITKLTRIPYEEIKKMILDENIKVVSFDVFDTLIVRPMFHPTDIFSLMEQYVMEILTTDDVVSFKEMRVEAEKVARNKKREKGENVEEVNLDEIYCTLGEIFALSEDSLNKIKAKEIELEIKYCHQRKAAKVLFDLALYEGKRIILVTDMYMPSYVIKEILNKNGYSGYSKMYVSNEVGLNKSGGTIYPYICRDLGIPADNILHIGDSWQGDIIKAERNGLKKYFFPKTTEKLMNFIKGNYSGEAFVNAYKAPCGFRRSNGFMNFIGMRVFLGVIANHYFDNPFRPFNDDSDFNADPRFLGYSALGMHMFAVAKWLIGEVRKNGHDTLNFLARDAYLPMKAFEELSRVFPVETRWYYTHLGRSTILPLQIHSDNDIRYAVRNIHKKDASPKIVLQWYEKFMSKEVLKNFSTDCEKMGFKYDEKFKDPTEYNAFIKFFVDNFYDKDRIKSYQEEFKKALLPRFKGNAATFDLGYHCRVEHTLQQYCNFNITAYYIHIDDDVPFYRNRKSGVKCHTFYSFSPLVSGALRELLISEVAPACIGLDFKDGKIMPIFEKYEADYFQEYVLSNVQESALKFIKDIVGVFKEETSMLFFSKEDASVLYEHFLAFPKQADYKLYSRLNFDNNFFNATSMVANTWDIQLKMRNINQKSIGGNAMTNEDLQRLKNPHFSFELMEDIYARFRFPWKAIKPGAHLVIYGGGVVGKIFIRQLANNPYCHVVAVCDQKPFKTEIKEVPVISITDLVAMNCESYDKVLIAIEKRNTAKEIRENLEMAGVPSDKIIWIDPRI